MITGGEACLVGNKGDRADPRRNAAACTTTDRAIIFRIIRSWFCSSPSIAGKWLIVPSQLHEVVPARPRYDLFVQAQGGSFVLTDLRDPAQHVVGMARAQPYSSQAVHLVHHVPDDRGPAGPTEASGPLAEKTG